MKKFIYSYKPGSRSARALSQELRAKRIKHNNSRFVPNENKMVINWGASTLPRYIVQPARRPLIINPPVCVSVASNKLRSLRALEEAGVPVPEFTVEREVAQSMLDGGQRVVVRHLLTANSGRGIELIEEGEVPEAPLYTKYLPKTNEYRVHVAGGEALSVQRKARSRDVADEDVNWQIRNHQNGFIFARNEGGETPECVEEAALDAVRALGLDFGAVDVVYNRRGAWVLEVNTAPGLEGTTLEEYVKYFESLGG